MFNSLMQVIECFICDRSSTKGCLLDLRDIFVRLWIQYGKFYLRSPAGYIFLVFFFLFVCFSWLALRHEEHLRWVCGGVGLMGILFCGYTILLWLNEYTHQEKNHEYITFLDKETHNHSNKVIVIIVIEMIISTLGSQMQAKIAFQAFLQFLTSAAFRSRWSRSTSELSSSGSVVC